MPSLHDSLLVPCFITSIPLAQAPAHTCTHLRTQKPNLYLLIQDPPILQTVPQGISLTSLSRASIAHIAHLLNSSDHEAMPKVYPLSLISTTKTRTTVTLTVQRHRPVSSTNNFWYDVLVPRFKCHLAHAHRNHPLRSRFLSFPSILL